MSWRANRLDDLLAQRATEGLSNAARDELEGLLDGRANVDAEAFDRAAAAVHLAAIGAIEPLPASLRTKLQRDAATHCAAAGASD